MKPSIAVFYHLGRRELRSARRWSQGDFWHRIPHLVCRNWTQLNERVNELLYKTSDLEYHEYLRRHLTHMGGYFDGQAITRLRKRLLSSVDGQL